MGDLVQVTPTTLALKKEFNAEITLLVTGNLETFAGRLSGVDHVISFNEDWLVPHLRRGGSIIEGFRAWNRFVELLRAEGFDKVINLTHDAFSTRLVSSIKAEVLAGRFQKSENAIQVKGRWLRYFFGVLSHRHMNGLNLVDIYRKGCGAGFYGDPVSMDVSLEDELELDNLVGNLGTNLVAIHPGANKDNRRFPIQHFCNLADKLVADGYDLIVLGSRKERPLAEKIVNASWGMAENLAGKVPLELLPAMIKRTRLLITNDTGPLHIGAAVGVPTISIFLAMARPEDTAPYGEGHWVFETMHETHPCPENEPCMNPVCGDTIPVEAIRKIVNVELNNTEFDPSDPVFNAGNYRLLKTRFDEEDELQVLDEIINTSPRTDIHVAHVMKKIVRHLYDMGDFDPSDAEKASSILGYEQLGILSKASELAISILQKIQGLDIQDTSGKFLSLMELENRWYDLESEANEAAFFMLPFRLERERLYANGLEFTREAGPDRFSKWISGISSIVKVQKAEVMV
jgi:ADP-heptose:LPS heptosyltransferase